MDVTAFLRGFQEKLAEEINEGLVDYKLDEPEITVRLKHMDRGHPLDPTDKKRAKGGDSVTKEAAVPTPPVTKPERYNVLAEQLKSFKKLPKMQGASAKPDVD